MHLHNYNNITDDRLVNYFVGISNMSSAVLKPSPDPLNYEICAHFYQSQGRGMKVIHTCVTSSILGRYVIVQMDHDWQYLTLCEVMVMGNKCKFSNISLLKIILFLWIWIMHDISCSWYCFSIYKLIHTNLLSGKFNVHPFLIKVK